jgi:putative oxidoreductase
MENQPMDKPLNFSPLSLERFFPVWSDRLLSVVRIIIAGLFMQHGMAKLFHVPHVAQFDSVQLFSLLGLAGMIELVGGFLLLIGLFARPAAFVLSGEMAVAYFMAHAPMGVLPLVNRGELAVVYCFVFLYFAVAGPGVWSFDAHRHQQKVQRHSFPHLAH